METRTITQIKWFKLVLNPMTASKIEFGAIAAISSDKEKLLEWYNNQKAPESYSDVMYTTPNPPNDPGGEQKRFHKTFKKGTRLEWFNPMDSEEKPNGYGHGIQEQWISEEDVQKFLQINQQVILVQ